MPQLPGLVVVRSSIHGYGVICTKPFAAGDVIAEVDGVALRLEEVVDDEYCLWVTDEMYFDMVDQTRWINHSCTPNGVVETELDESGRVSARIVALRDIAPGEEITYDYEFAVEHAIPCHCQSPGCRGMIIDAAACA
ncbi:MAG TPA: SET domain-containing protein-lysine N-methyltransferase [Polyangia bacterium]